MFAVANEIEIDETRAMQKMEELTNVKWEVQSVTGADLEERRNLLLNSNQYPDVFMKSGLNQATLDSYGSQGTFIALNDLIDQYAPNLTKLYEERTGVRYAITSGDGNIYAIGGIDNPSSAASKLYVNQPWLDKLGLESPANLDELYDVLTAFKTKDPNGNGQADEIPLTCSANGSPVTLLLPYFGVTFDSTTYTGMIDGEYVYVPTTETFKEYLIYLKKLYDEGLLDKNSFTQDMNIQRSTAPSNDIYGMFFEAGAFLTVGRERDADFPIVMPFEEGVWPTTAGAGVGAFAVTDACETPEIAVAWVDQWYSEEGGRLGWMGVEGESYKINDDGTWEWILGEYDDISQLRPQVSLIGAASQPCVQPELWSKNMADASEVKVTEESNALVEVGADPLPSLKISEADNKTIASVNADVQPYVDQYIAQVVTGRVELDSSWEEYLTTLNNMGLEKMMDIYNAAYESATK